MLELIWALLNLSLFVSFIIICFKSAKLIKERVGLLVAIIFVMGSVSLISRPRKEKIADVKTDIINPANSEKAFKGNSFFKTITLEDNLISNIKLSVLVGENDLEVKILDAYCNRSGYVSGTEWNLTNVHVVNDKNFGNYTVSGTMEWKIFGINVYSESKFFTGKVVLIK